MTTKKLIKKLYEIANQVSDSLKKEVAPKLLNMAVLQISLVIYLIMGAKVV